MDSHKNPWVLTCAQNIVAFNEEDPKMYKEMTAFLLRDGDCWLKKWKVIQTIYPENYGRGCCGYDIAICLLGDEEQAPSTQIEYGSILTPRLTYVNAKEN